MPNQSDPNTQTTNTSTNQDLTSVNTSSDVAKLGTTSASLPQESVTTNPPNIDPITPSFTDSTDHTMPMASPVAPFIAKTVEETMPAQGMGTVPPPPTSNYEPVILNSSSDSSGDSGGKPVMSKGVIAGILGVLVLVLGVGTGVVLVQRNQNVNRRAAAPDTPLDCVIYNEGGANVCGFGATRIVVDSTSTNCSGFQIKKLERQMTDASQRTCFVDENDPDVVITWQGMSPGGVYEVDDISDCKCVQKDVYYNGSYQEGNDVSNCGDFTTSCIPTSPPTATPTGTPLVTATPTATPTSTPLVTSTPTATPTSTPTMTPTPTGTPIVTLPPGSAQCFDVRAYRVNGDPKIYSNWQRLSSTDLSALVPGEVVYFTVAGTENVLNGDFDKAQFEINGVIRPEVTTRKPLNAGPELIPSYEIEYYDVYTMPAGTTQFTVDGRLHHETAGWIGLLP